MHKVQAIAVRPSTHFETISAVAIASNVMFAAADQTSEPWRSWLNSDYTKNVRSIRRPAELTRVEAMDAATARFTSGRATAFAFEPLPYADFPQPLKKLQVTGLDLPRSDSSFTVVGPIKPLVAINSNLTMSTGKTAAQVAHGLMLWLREQDEATMNLWKMRPCLRMRVAPLETLEQPGVTVIDNGHTELEPHTATVRVALAAG
ncbi:hypothetical protein ANMWB30_24360 [Arthrobacter sp. MWB30]|nr:hypothetical protein ANMWB30_24360 [Arthrobacter sp. MWB30]